ncbi:MAG: hypothetical protein ACP5NP_11895 [Acetobacteraceae bacterium]
MESVALGALGGFIASLMASLVFQGITARITRQNSSRLGVAIVGILKTEVEKGINELMFIQEHGYAVTALPSSAWSGVDAIPNEVLLRIVSIDRCSNGSKSSGYPPREILIRCNEYFAFTCGRMNAILNKSGPVFVESGPSAVQDLARDWLPHARHVQAMLADTERLLRNNSERLLPR